MKWNDCPGSLEYADKGGISALRVSKHLRVSWITARNMLRKIRKAMAHRDSIYRLSNIVEFDDTYVGGKRAGKREEVLKEKHLCL